MPDKSSPNGAPPLSDYPLPYAVQLARGSAFAKFLLRLWGWRVDFAGLPAKQCVLAVYPHTSNWDFPLGVLVKWSLYLPAKYWGKDSLFKVPVFGQFVRWVGGIPVDRSSPHGMVGSAVRQMQQAQANDDFFVLVIAPEGTRSRTAGFKSGFYQLALQAGVPLGLVHFDWGKRVVRILDFIRLSGDEAADYARIAAIFDGVEAHTPANAAPIAPLPRKNTP